MSYETTNPQSYCSRAEIKGHLAEGDPAEDTLIDFLIPVVSRWIDNYKSVPVSYYNNGDAAGYGVAEIHRYDGSVEGEQWIDRCTSIDSVHIEESDATLTEWVEETDFIGWPYNTSYIACLVVKEYGAYSTWPDGQRNIIVTALWGGYTETPEPVKESCIILVARLLQGGKQMFEEQSAITELGQILYHEPLGQTVRVLLASIEGRITIA